MLFDLPELPATLAELGFNDKTYATTLWDDIWQTGHGFYRESTDKYIIERYVGLQVRRAKLIALLEIEGYVTLGSQGQEVAHPAARLLNDVEGKLPALEDRLGLSPEARLRLGLAAAETKSKLDAFIDDEPIA